VGQHDALGQACRPAGVREDGEVGDGVDLDRVRRRRLGRGQFPGLLDHVRLANPREVCLRRADRGHEGLRGEDNHRLRIIELMLHLALAVEGVQRGHLRSAEQRPVQDDRVLGTVRGENRDGLAFAEAGLSLQERGELLRGLPDLPERVRRFVDVDQGGLVRQTLGRFGE